MDSFFVMSSLNKKVKKENVLFVCTEDWFFKSHFLPLHRAVLLLNQNYKTILVSTQSCSSKELKCFGIELKNKCCNLFVERICEGIDGK